MSIIKPLSMQNQTVGIGGQTQSIKMQISLLINQQKQIEANSTLTDQEKKKRMQMIQDKIDDLNEQIAKIQKKQMQKQQQQVERQQCENIEETMDPEAAELALKLQDMIKVALAAADKTGEDDIMDDEIIQSLNSEGNKIQERESTSSSETKESFPQEESFPQAESSPQDKLEQFMEKLHDKKKDAEVLKRVKMGLIVDEYK